MSKKPAKKKVLSRLKPLYPRTFIREWRNYRGLTLEDLAAKASEIVSERYPDKKDGVGYTQLSRIESRRQPYTQPTLEAIATALDTDAPSLLMRLPPKKDDPDDPWRIWTAWERATEAERKRMARAVDVVMDKTGTDD